VVSEENVVALVVKGHGSSTLELRVVVEEGGQHSADCLTQAGLEIV